MAKQPPPEERSKELGIEQQEGSGCVCRKVCRSDHGKIDKLPLPGAVAGTRALCATPLALSIHELLTKGRSPNKGLFGSRGPQGLGRFDRLRQSALRLLALQTPGDPPDGVGASVPEAS